MENYEQEVTEVISLQKAFLKAAREKNDSFMHEKLHPQFIFTSPRAVILNKDSFTKNFVLNPDVKLEVFQLMNENVVIIGDTGLLHCLVQVKVAGQEDFWEIITFTLIKEGGNWLNLAMHATFRP
jgi:hypothetical protein